MKYQRKELWGHTWLGWVNILILQWFFIRLAECKESKTGEHTEWIIIFRIPLTGYQAKGILKGRPKEKG